MECRAEHIKELLETPEFHSELKRTFGDTCTQDLLLRHINAIVFRHPNQLDSTGFLQGVLEYMDEHGEL